MKIFIYCFIASFFNFVVGLNVFAQEVATTNEQNTFADALTRGKIDFGMRYRYEHVDDNAVLNKADASTVRTALGYQMGFPHDFSLRLLVQDVRIVGIDDFNDGTGRSNAKTSFAVVADPSDTDFLEGYASFSGIKNTSAKLGRQIITYRDAPFHRFIGTVLWRQNWQNHDAFSIVNKTLPNTTISYAYSWNINRIFTNKAVGSRAHYDSDSHFVNLKYQGFKYGKVEAYSYLLDFKNSTAESTATYGIRFNGSYPVTDKINTIYTVEFATQDEYANNPASIGEDYFLGELGGNFKPDHVLDSVLFKLCYELLTGNGTSSFKTPLATGHAYQGWADRFLRTPGDGLKDIYFTVVARALGIDINAEYHDLSSDNDNYDYGTEIDLQATKSLNKNFSVGLKYSNYDANNNSININRNGAIAANVSKLWTWIEFKY